MCPSDCLCITENTEKNNVGPTGHAALHLFLAWKPVIRNSLPVHRCVCVRVYSEHQLIRPPPHRTFIWGTFMFFAVHWFAPPIGCLWKSAEPVAALTASRRDVWSERVPATAWVGYYVRLTHRYWHMLLVSGLQILLQGGVFIFLSFLFCFVFWSKLWNQWKVQDQSLNSCWLQESAGSTTACLPVVVAPFYLFF